MSRVHGNYSVNKNCHKITNNFAYTVESQDFHCFFALCMQ